MAYLSEVLKEGIEVKIKEEGNSLLIEGETISGLIDISPFDSQNNRIKLKTLIFSEETNYKKIEAEVEFLVQSISKNIATLIPQTIINLDESEIDVNSSAIEFINYLPKEQIMIVSFWDQGAYAYFNVPSGVYALVALSDSKGKAYHQYVKYSFQEKEIEKDSTIEDVKKMGFMLEEKSKHEKRLKVSKEFILTSKDSDKLYKLYFSGKLPLEVKILFVQNPNAGEEILEDLFKLSSLTTQEQILAHPQVSSDLLEKAQTSLEITHRKAVARNPKTQSFILEALLKDNSNDVRQWVLSNPNLPQEAKQSYQKKGLLRGFLKLPQWCLDVAHISVLENPKQEAIFDDKSLDLTLHLKQPKPSRGEIVVKVEGDGTLILVDQNFDSR